MPSILSGTRDTAARHLHLVVFAPVLALAAFARLYDLASSGLPGNGEYEHLWVTDW